MFSGGGCSLGHVCGGTGRSRTIDSRVRTLVVVYFASGWIVGGELLMDKAEDAIDRSAHGGVRL